MRGRTNNEAFDRETGNERTRRSSGANKRAPLLEDNDDIGESIGHAAAVLRRRANVPQYTTHPVCGRSRTRNGRPSESDRERRNPGEVRHEIGILMDCAILSDEI